MGKSKHPKLLQAALEDIAQMNDGLKENAATLRKTMDTCKNTIDTANLIIRESQAQYKYLSDVIEKYAKKAVEIESLEDDDNPDQKKLDKLEKEADALRKEYNQGVKGVAALSATMGEQLKTLGEAGKGYRVFKA